MRFQPEKLDAFPSWMISLGLTFFGPIQFKQAMEHENMIKFLSTEGLSFDLVIVESSGKEAFYAFGEYFNAPIIATSTTVNGNWLNQAIGNVEPWSFVPNMLIATGSEITFPNRLKNVIFNLFELASIRIYSVPMQNALMRKYFPKNKKSLQEVFRNDVCLGFVNSHFTLSLPRPYVPNMIEIGGINIDPQIAELPKDFREFMDSAEDGVILFTLGSIFQASTLSVEQRRAFVSVFSRLKQKVIWRYNLPDADKLPENIMARPWLPQKEILAHPNTRLFITHAGMLGRTEAYFNGVPMLGIPMFLDQHSNVARSVQQGVAVLLDKGNLTEESVSWAIQEALGQSYKDKMMALSAAYHDQVLTPQKIVVYWSDYIVKHKCAKFMRVAGHTMGVIAYHNLDVWLILGLLKGLCLVLIFRYVSERFRRSLLTKQQKAVEEENKVK